MERSIGNFSFHKTQIEGVYHIEMKKHGDNRGFFMETYKREALASAGLNYNFVQDNCSLSRKGVLRGLHYQKKYPQAKLVYVISGKVFDVAVDLRRDSATYGRSICAELSDENNRQLLIPRGFAHGFLVMSDFAIFAYKCDDYYYPEDEGGIAWNDPEIAIPWPEIRPILSEKDQHNPSLSECGITFAL